ncbi:MAG: hypothetical protein AB7F97_03580 [Solirubrobacterales bacterium]
MERTFPDRSEWPIQDLDAGGSRFGPSAELDHRASVVDCGIGSGPTGWRKTFGDLWSSAAVARGARPIRPQDAIPTAAAILDENEVEIVRLLAVDGQDGRRLLLAAASVIESCAQTRGALGAPGGGRRVHLLHGLERRLNRIESLTRCAERSYAQALAPSAIHRPALGARQALALLGSESADRPEAFSSFEAGSLALAAAAAQGAINFESAGAARPERDEAASMRGKELERTVDEVSRGAHALQRAVGYWDAAVWLEQCLSLRPPHAAMHFARRADVDRNLRAEALVAVRAFWLRVGAREMPLLERLDQQRGKPRSLDSLEMREAISLRAGKLLSDCYLDQRPQLFAHEEAWHQQNLHLARVAALAWREPAPRHGHQRADLASRCVLARLSRALVAIWVIDAETGFTTPASEGRGA